MKTTTESPAAVVAERKDLYDDCPLCRSFGRRRCRVITPPDRWGVLVCLPWWDDDKPALGYEIGECDRCEGTGRVRLL